MLAGEIRANIMRLREARNWSRPDLAKRVKPETSGQQIEKLEKGERRLTVEWIEKLAAAFGVPPYQLIVPENGASLNLTEPVAAEVARTFGRVATGEEPEDSVVKVLAIMLQELCETFSRHPVTRRDPAQVRPVADLLERRFAPQSS